MEFKYSYKVIVAGDSGVGKTSIVNRCVYGQFSQTLPLTIGISNFQIIEKVDNCDVELRIWDTAGQERYSSLIPMFSKGADICILVASINSPASFQHLANWHKIIMNEVDVPTVLAINKIDVAQDIENSEIKEILKSYQHKFFVSALNGEGLSELFSFTAQLAKAGDQHELVQTPPVNEKSGCC